jgi:hypothetical protein
MMRRLNQFGYDVDRLQEGDRGQDRRAILVQEEMLSPAILPNRTASAAPPAGTSVVAPSDRRAVSRVKP